MRLRPEPFASISIPLAELQQVDRQAEGRAGAPVTKSPFQQIHVVVRPGLVAQVDSQRQFPRWVLGVLVVRGSAREAFEARIGETTAREAVN
jgi:hypothetical protein